MYSIFEGIDTSGKSTQIQLIKERYPYVLTTSESGGTVVGKEIRNLILNGETKSTITNTLLFLADSAEHYELVIKPNNTIPIVSDRGFISGITYATASGDFDTKALKELYRVAMCNTLPDKVVMFKISADTLSRRLGEKELDVIEKKGIDYLMSIQDIMLKTIKEYGINYLMVDGNDKIEKIHTDIIKYLKL